MTTHFISLSLLFSFLSIIRELLSLIQRSSTDKSTLVIIKNVCLQFVSARSWCSLALFNRIINFFPHFFVNGFQILLRRQIIIQYQFLNLPNAVLFIPLLSHLIPRSLNKSRIGHRVPILPLSTALHLHWFLHLAHISLDIPKHLSQQECVSTIHPDTFQVCVSVVE